MSHATIVIITKNYPPAICGVGDYSHHLRQALQAQGYAVKVLTHSTGGYPPGWDIHYVRHWPQDLLPALHLLHNANPQLQLLWQYTPASFHPRQTPFWWPMLMRRLNRLGMRQSIVFHEVALRPEGNILQRLRSLAQQWIARRAQALAAGSSTSVALYRQYFHKRQPLLIPVGANFLPLQEFVPMEVKKDRLQFFCFANRCSLAMLEALCNWGIQSGDWCLHLAGRCHLAQQKAIDNWIKGSGLVDNVRLHGELTDIEMAELWQSIHLFLQAQPLSSKGSGGVSGKNGITAAAFAFGLPVITTFGDMTDSRLFSHGQNCWLIRQDDARHWLMAITNLATDPALRQKLGQAARQTFEQQLSWPHIARQIATQLLDVAHPNPEKIRTP